MKKKYNTPYTYIEPVCTTSYLCMAGLSSTTDPSSAPAPVRLTGPKQEARILYV